MDEEKRFYQKPGFKSLVLGILLLVIYGLEYKYDGGIINIPGIVFDVVLLFFLFQIAAAFYAQFVLPIHKRGDRSKVIGRLWLHAMGGHGPAIFVKNGRLVESKNESEKKGPGVLWLDTASAVVTRTDTSLKNFLGPGVHFTDADEKIASVISLHTQSHRIGPDKDDDPFKPAKDYAAEEDYKKVHDRRMAVSAITRDGIEVVPNISVTLKIDAMPAKGTEKGSRFGFDQDAVEKAARGEGMSAASSEPKHVAWNQIAALIAADLWREYLSKFTVNDLFSASLEPLSDVPQPEAPVEKELPKILEPAKIGLFTKALRTLNNSFEKRLKKLAPNDEVMETKAVEKSEGRKKTVESKPQTALQIVNQMMKARMTQAVVPMLDESGRQLEGFGLSKEFRTLSERGIRVSSVSVSNLRFHQEIEDQLVSNWNTNWLENARADNNRVERLKHVYEENGSQKARQEHASTLSEAINNPPDIASAVRNLLQQIEAEIRQDDRLLAGSRAENQDIIQDIDEIISWMESKEL